MFRLLHCTCSRAGSAEAMKRATESLNSADWFPAPQAAFQESNYDTDIGTLCFTGTITYLSS